MESTKYSVNCLFQIGFTIMFFFLAITRALEFKLPIFKSRYLGIQKDNFKWIFNTYF